MKWKKHTLRIALISFSIITSFFAIAPDAASLLQISRKQKNLPVLNLLCRQVMVPPLN